MSPDSRNLYKENNKASTHWCTRIFIKAKKLETISKSFTKRSVLKTDDLIHTKEYYAVTKKNCVDLNILRSKGVHDILLNDRSRLPISCYGMVSIM